MHDVHKSESNSKHVSGLTEEELKFKLQGIVGCMGDMCWPCPHWGVVEKLMDLIKAIREGK
jgi:hypothetical protein